MKTINKLPKRFFPSCILKVGGSPCTRKRLSPGSGPWRRFRSYQTAIVPNPDSCLRCGSYFHTSIAAPPESDSRGLYEMPPEDGAWRQALRSDLTSVTNSISMKIRRTMPMNLSKPWKQGVPFYSGTPQEFAAYIRMPNDHSPKNGQSVLALQSAPAAEISAGDGTASSALAQMAAKPARPSSQIPFPLNHMPAIEGAPAIGDRCALTKSSQVGRPCYASPTH
jgi:hypothetical protein